MKPTSVLLTIVMALGLTAPAALADWTPADGHKMHYPQLPDPEGWDVRATAPLVLADDFRCSASGPITDIHFWGSWRQNAEWEIENFHLSIHEDIPADVSPTGYSTPGPLLWEYDTLGDFGIVPIDPPSLQGWFNPMNQMVIPGDHDNYYQYNVFIPEPLAFRQDVGTIYWLDISVQLLPGSQMQDWGWKTSASEHFNDDAVWWDPDPIAGGWKELRDPLTGESLDLAFVITPEPATLGLALLGAFALLRRRR
jgi:hypothetical protein